MQQIKPGMSLAEVTTLLGPPLTTAMMSQGTVVSWAYVSPVKVAPFYVGGRPESRSVSITFRDGKVVDAPGT